MPTLTGSRERHTIARHIRYALTRAAPPMVEIRPGANGVRLSAGTQDREDLDDDVAQALGRATTVLR